MSEKLESLFLRHSAVGEGEAELAEELAAEIERLTDTVGEWSRLVGGVPAARYPGHLISACDEAISRALRACEIRDYASAFDGLQRSRAAIVEISTAWEANRAYDEARAAQESLHVVLPSGCLKPLLTLRDLALLLDNTCSLLERGKYRQAHLLARACLRRGEILSARHEAVPEELRARAWRLSALCDEAASFLPPGREDWADGGALAAVDALLREQRCALAERLLCDLEVEMTPHRTFLEAYRRLRTEAHDSAADADLRAVVAAQSWEAATCCMLQGALCGLSDRIAMVTARVAAIGEQVAAYAKATGG